MGRGDVDVVVGSLRAHNIRWTASWAGQQERMSHLMGRVDFVIEAATAHKISWAAAWAGL